MTEDNLVPNSIKPKDLIDFTFDTFFCGTLFRPTLDVILTETYVLNRVKPVAQEKLRLE